ncbi:MAG: BamA/TamA family outer membrane protein [Candidatus Marinimicrobia bacterium]|nr:BamA/TamA family outer membrane protein [Candidatus Neomarinimicrobiota bacterium]
MRFFKVIIILIFIFYINIFGREYRIGKVFIEYFGRDTVDFSGISILDDYVSIKASQETILELMNHLKNWIYDNNGYETFISVENINPTLTDSVVYINPKLKVMVNKRIVVDSILVKGVNDRLKKILVTKFKEFIGKSMNSDEKIAMRKIISNYKFIKLAKEPVIVKSIDGKNCLYIELEEARENKFLGSLAYVPRKGTTDGYFTGNFEMNLHNFSGLGRKIEISWMRLNQYSQELMVYYFQPFVLQKYIFFDLKFSQVLRDTLYVLRSFYFSSGRSFKNVRLGFILGGMEGMPTKSGKKLLNETSNRERSLGISFFINTRNNDKNPKKGYFVTTNLLGNYRNYMGDKSYGYSIELNYDFNMSISSFVFNLNGLLGKKWVNLETPLYTDYFWVGGARDLRGYAEDFFKGLTVFVTSFEIRKLLGLYSRVFMFTDLGYIDGVIPYSYGFGMMFNSRVGIVGLTYALGKDDTFSTAKIHLVLENRF